MQKNKICKSQVLAIIVGLGLAHMLRFTTIWDDAFISFRVVQHFVETGFPLYNLGQLEWIPSTLFWVVMMAIIHKITTMNLPLISQLLGAISGILIIFILYKNTIVKNTKTPSIIAATLCVLAPIWSAWPLSGMEITFFTLIITLAVLVLMNFISNMDQKRLILSAILFGIATVTRWEGSLLFFVALIFLTFNTKALKPIVIFSGVYGLTILPGIVYLMLTFGSIFPSSYFVKVHGLQNIHVGKEYIKSFINTYHLILVLPFLITAFINKNKQIRISVLFVSAIIIVWLAYVAIVGGDFMPFHRFISPMWPLICIWFSIGFYQVLVYLKNKWPKHYFAINIIAIGYLSIIFYFITIPSFKSDDINMTRQWSVEEKDRKSIGKWLKNNYPINTTIAVRPAGIIPFYSELIAFDFYCLTSRESARTAQFVKHHWVGHQLVNINWILNKKPDIVILDEHLYEQGKLPNIFLGDGIIESQWRINPLNKNYRLKKAEINKDEYLQYYEIH